MKQIYNMIEETKIYNWPLKQLYKTFIYTFFSSKLLSHVLGKHLIYTDH